MGKFGGGAQAGGGGPVLEADTYGAKISGVWYIGSCDNPWDDTKRPSNKLVVNFTVEECYNIEPNDNNPDGFYNHKNIVRDYLFSHGSTNLKSLYKAVLGREPSEEEINDPSCLFRKTLMIEIDIGAKKGKSYVAKEIRKKDLELNIDAKKIGFTPSVYDISEHSLEEFLKLPERGLIRMQVVTSNDFTEPQYRELPLEVREKLENFESVKKKYGGGESSSSTNSSGASDEFDDDLPEDF